MSTAAAQAREALAVLVRDAVERQMVALQAFGAPAIEIALKPDAVGLWRPTALLQRIDQAPRSAAKAP